MLEQCRIEQCKAQSECFQIQDSAGSYRGISRIRKHPSYCNHHRTLAKACCRVLGGGAFLRAKYPCKLCGTRTELGHGLIIVLVMARVRQNGESSLISSVISIQHAARRSRFTQAETGPHAAAGPHCCSFPHS